MNEEKSNVVSLLLLWFLIATMIWGAVLGLAVLVVSMLGTPTLNGL